VVNLITGLVENMQLARAALSWLAQAGYADDAITLCLKSSALTGDLPDTALVSAPAETEATPRSIVDSPSLLDRMLVQETTLFPECGLIIAGRLARQIGTLQVGGLELPEWLALVGVPPHRVPYYMHGMQQGSLTLAVRVPASDSRRVFGNLQFWGRGVEVHEEPKMAIPYRFATGERQVSLLTPAR
jgi:hypothetical protein